MLLEPSYQNKQINILANLVQVNKQNALRYTNILPETRHLTLLAKISVKHLEGQTSVVTLFKTAMFNFKSKTNSFKHAG